MEEVVNFKPRNYQLELMKIAVKSNTIIYLPTGSGKTYISLLVLKELSSDLERKYSQGGKISIILVNSIPLVDQHAKYICNHTALTVGTYTGDMKLDFWPKEQWYDEYDKYQVLIMTVQILVNNVNNCYIDLNKVNLLILDECHHGVSDHSMRQLMKSFANLTDPPRVLGLTATLLNGNCKPKDVEKEVRALEITYHSQVATVDGLDVVLGHSTNPQEKFQFFETHVPLPVEVNGCAELEQLIEVLAHVKLDNNQHLPPKPHLKPLDVEDGLKQLTNMIKDYIIHIKMLGLYGGIKAGVSLLIRTERLRKHCVNSDLDLILSYVLSVVSFTVETFRTFIGGYSEKVQMTRFSSNQVLQLLNILRQYAEQSQEELCAIIFTKRRITAKLLHHILEDAAQFDSSLSHIKSNFIVGYMNNPYKDTRESLYIQKKNREILNSFTKKQINVLCASNVLEEGVDIPKCTLVIRFDKPEDYRSYMQSKGRARHKLSLFYIMLEHSEATKYLAKYQEFQVVEEKLNTLLVGCNLLREAPSESDIQGMYEEDYIPPFFVNGPQSACITSLSAIPLLCQYCQNLPSDIYTIYEPEWYLDKNCSKGFKVTIILPIISPVRDIIEGPVMPNLKLAKRAAAMKACILLYKNNELDDHLLPKRQQVVEEDVSYLFPHYPAIKETHAGTIKNRRFHRKVIPDCIKGKPITHNVYLNIIHFEPQFSRKENIVESTMYDIYSSNLTFGLISADPLPEISKFPIFVSQGSIKIWLQSCPIVLRQKEVDDIISFQHLIYDQLLGTIKSFLIFDNNFESEMLLLAPVYKDKKEIAFDVIYFNTDLNSVVEPSKLDKLKLEVTQENYLNKIVQPWYKNDITYLVLEVSLNKSAKSQFPNEDFQSFQQYFESKYPVVIENPNQPLLLVKAISSSLKMTKPRSLENKRKHSMRYEESEEYLIPEMVVKQDMPASLWIQAKCIPTIVDRVLFLVRLKSFRDKIVKEAGFRTNACSRLVVDENLLNYKANIEESPSDNEDEDTDIYENLNENDVKNIAANQSPVKMRNLNCDYERKVLEKEYPWNNLDEPKDIERELNVSSLDIGVFEKFICERVNHDGLMLKNEFRNRLPAITYSKQFTEKKIHLLDNQSNLCPDLREMHRALTTAKANDIVNLERLETLGDSYLKIISTLFIYFKFPNFNEGQATSLKCRMVSNKNLFYLAQKKDIGGIMKHHDFEKGEWLPPSYTVPKIVSDHLSQHENEINVLWHIRIPSEEQKTGILTPDTISFVQMELNHPEEGEEVDVSLSSFVHCNFIGDKYVADCVESLIGAFFESGGFNAAFKLTEWIGIIPRCEQFMNLLSQPVASPILNARAASRDVDKHIPLYSKLEDKLGYRFKNRGFLLQALTHSSYTPNRITLSYEKLEFLGDAILDFLITCYIYENCGYFSPGELTDLRSALVNNNTFASLVVRNDFHKFLLICNQELQGHIDKFANYLAGRNYVIDDEVLILLDETDLKLAEYIDVPKVLGDLFEALAGAVYLDSNKSLETVWRVFYKLMHNEIDLFSRNVPKNVVRKLYEWPGAYPKFRESRKVNDKVTMIPLDFMVNGRTTSAYGFGSNKSSAKRAAAKIALRALVV